MGERKRKMERVKGMGCHKRGYYNRAERKTGGVI